MIRYIYSLGIYGFLLTIKAASLFAPKAKAWVDGRRNWRSRLREALKTREGRPLVWVHCASLGEFEQGRPLIEGIKADHPEVFILLSFFSPSGYEVRKNYALADAVVYLPADTRANARDFLRNARPGLVIFIKYEFWFNFLSELRQQNVPAILAAARLRPDQLFFKPYGKWFREQVRAFRHIFLQEALDERLMDTLGIPYTVAGDPRIDRVLAIAGENRTFPEIEAFCAGQPVLIAGSTWPPDEALLAELVRHPSFEGWKLIIAPHDIAPQRLQALEEKIPLQALRYSRIGEGDPSGARMLVIDNIGMLSALYRYGQIAYIGGAFGSGLHNTLEPIAFRLPVLFGPKYRKFSEAIYLVDHGGGQSIRDAGELIAAFTGWTDVARREHAAQAAFGYITQNQGAAQRILRHPAVLFQR